jgi:hypothetical protein
LTTIIDHDSPRARTLPAKGWVQPGEVVYCDVCARRVYVWELHHLVPIAWGGSDSRRVDDHQVIWVRADGDCHAVIHMILDKAKAAGAWPTEWLDQQDGIPHLIVETARRGWNTWRQGT